MRQPRRNHPTMTVRQRVCADADRPPDARLAVPLTRAELRRALAIVRRRRDAKATP